MKVVSGDLEIANTLGADFDNECNISNMHQVSVSDVLDVVNTVDVHDDNTSSTSNTYQDLPYFLQVERLIENDDDIVDRKDIGKLITLVCNKVLKNPQSARSE